MRSIKTTTPSREQRRLQFKIESDRRLYAETPPPQLDLDYFELRQRPEPPAEVPPIAAPKKVTREITTSRHKYGCQCLDCKVKRRLAQIDKGPRTSPEPKTLKSSTAGRTRRNATEQLALATRGDDGPVIRVKPIARKRRPSLPAAPRPSRARPRTSLSELADAVALVERRLSK